MRRGDGTDHGDRNLRLTKTEDGETNGGTPIPPRASTDDRTVADGGAGR